MKKAFIVYCSPAGATAHVAGVIAEALKLRTVGVETLNLGSGEDSGEFLAALHASRPDACLFVGSPVYRDMATYPVMSFLDHLPESDGRPAVPFVTWGGALSGIALWQMGKVLQEKRYTLIGAAKVLAVHSLMYSSGSPLGGGHPDASDDEKIRTLVDRAVERTSTSAGDTCLDTLDYQPDKIGEAIKAKLGQPWQIIPKSVDDDACTLCGTCAEVCPVNAVTLNPGPVFNNACFDCFNCIRECPEEAISSAMPLEKIAAMIHKRVETFNEKPSTQIFL